MATQTQTVIIDFQADFSSVQDAVDILEKTGKVDAELAATFRKTNTEIVKQGQALKTTSLAGQQSTQNFTKLSQLMQQFPKSGMNRFLLQVGKELTDAGLKADQFFNKTTTGSKQATTQFTSLRQELKSVREAMQIAAVTSGVLSDEYKKLKARAGELDDAIRDVNSDIKNAGSDTRGIDNVVGSISALAGGYSVVQGAAALFGEESEDLQRALLKVNAAMALATGLQQVSNALQKEGSLIRLKDAIATYGQAAAQRVYAFVVGQSIGVMKAFRIALASTGIGLLVIGLVALISKLGGASRATKQLKKDLEALRAGTDAARETIQQEGEVAIALLEERGVKQSKISKEKLQQLENERTAEEAGLIKLENRRTELVKQRKSDNIDDISAAIKGIELVDEQIVTSEKNIAALRSQLQVGKIKQRTEDKQERDKDAEDQKKEQDALNKELLAKQKEAAEKAREARLQDAKALAQLKLNEAKDGSEAQLEAQKKLLGAELDLAMNNEELTRHQKLLLADQYFRDYEQLNKDFQARNAQIELDTLSRSLLNRNVSNENRALLEEAFIRKTAEIEIAAAVGNAEKIKLIAAKRDQDIADAHIAAIRKSAEQEAALTSAKGGAGRRALESVASNERAKQEVRVNAINQLFQIEAAAIDRQIKANRDAAAIQGADQKVLEIEYEQLLDQKDAATENAEGRITALIQSENEKRKASDIAYIQATIGGLQSLADIVSGIQSNQQEATQQAIDLRRRELEELLDSGAITEKQARERNRRLDAEERQAKNRAAQQQKNLAVFQALLAIPQAYIAGLTAPFPVGGPLYGAVLAGLAGIQAGIIASRPVPRFASGKKGSYEGLGVVGDAGAELVQQGGRMWVADKPTTVYLGSRDKVYTHAETKNIMPFVNKDVMKPVNGKEFDYTKMAKAMTGKSSSTSINIDKEFISESVADGLSRVNYFNRYYSSK